MALSSKSLTARTLAQRSRSAVAPVRRSLVVRAAVAPAATKDIVDTAVAAGSFKTLAAAVSSLLPCCCRE